ncbi:MAG: ATP-binding protein [Vampirovibrionales bacterium]|nr:ATP-binding protein [Vampirovibrionales bacterium]
MSSVEPVRSPHTPPLDADNLEALLDESSPLIQVLQKLGDGVAIFDTSGRVRWLNLPLKCLFYIRPHTRQHEALTTALEALYANCMGQANSHSKTSGASGASGAPGNSLATAPVSQTLAPQTLTVDWQWPETFRADVGRPRLFEVSLSPLELNAELPGPEGHIALLRDMTAIKTTEKMRRDFVANVSHELRTPLSILKGYAETLLDGALEEPPVAQEFVKIMHQHAERLTRLVEDLLDLSRLEQADYQIELSPVDACDVFDRVLALHQHSAEARRITLTKSFPQALPCVLAHTHSLEQVMTNLLDNAIKYTPQGGAIHVSAEALEPTGAGGSVGISGNSGNSGNAKPRSQKLLFKISDNGQGIEAKHIPRLFERFYRVDKARSRDMGGTGLGLSIVKHIIQVHGGHIWLESTPAPAEAHGTTFFFTLLIP